MSLSCPFCGLDTAEFAEEALRIHCLWKHPIEYVSEKRKKEMEELRPELDRTSTSPLEKKSFPTRKRRLSSPTRHSSKDSTVKCEHNFKPCRDFPACRGKLCSFSHPKCTQPPCLNSWCPFDHLNQQKVCIICRPSQKAPRISYSDLIVRCSHRKIVKFRNYPNCFKPDCCYQHEICNDQGCALSTLSVPPCSISDMALCNKDHISTYYFCQKCQRYSRRWKKTFHTHRCPSPHKKKHR